MKEISKQQANYCAKIVSQYAKQQAIKHTKKGAKVTAAATKKVAKAGFGKLKSLFK